MPATKTLSLYLVLLAAGVFFSGARGEVIFSEDFESGSLGEKWERYREGQEYGGFETRAEFVHSGKMSYRVTAPASKRMLKFVMELPNSST